MTIGTEPRKELRKDDYVTCVYDEEELLGRIVRKVEGGYIVSLMITHYSSGKRLMQDICMPEDKVRPVDIVVQEAMKYKKRNRPDSTTDAEEIEEE